MYKFVRCVCAVPDVKVADVTYNTDEILKKIFKAQEVSPDFIVFPELCITGYTCQDLFFQRELLSRSADAVREIAEKTKAVDTVIIIGFPFETGGQLYNCAAVIFKGQLLGIVPKSFLPNYGEFYEKRWFSSAFEMTEELVSSKAFSFSDDYNIPIGRSIVFCIHGEDDFKEGLKFGVEICEDLWSVIPPSSQLSLEGAEMIFNLSASNELIGKKEFRKNLVKNQSASTVCAYLYASAGTSESTQDLIFSGHSIICENGSLIAENANVCENDYMLYADIDIEKIRYDRMKIKNFKDSRKTLTGLEKPRIISAYQKSFSSDGSLMKIKKMPFVPYDKNDRLNRCMDIFKMQTEALKKRLLITGARPVVGVSGGLDSTLALLVSVKAAKEAGMPPSSVYGITLPCFGTSDRTYSNALTLMKTLGISSSEINIKDACLKHFEDIGHNPEKLDLTYENAQARERTQVLMDIAGEVGGLVVGTGDLSELALGWCTYNADHMSMYGVNAGIPKTLIRWMLDTISELNIFPESSKVLKDICDTPISPELLPPDKNGEIAQETEAIVGPYPLHDFFLYNILRYGFAPDKVFYLARLAFGDDYSAETVLKWLKSFYRRFFTQHFKRSCLPDGVKIGSISLSPRGDLRMPTDASFKLWLDKAEQITI